MSQNQRVLDYLKTGKTITSLGAYNRMGILRLSARIYDLKQEDHNIICRRHTVVNRFNEKCTIAEYQLLENK